MAIKLDNIRDLLMPGLRHVTGSYTSIPKQWNVIFQEHDEGMANDNPIPTTENSDYLNGLAAAEDFINENKNDIRD